MIGHKRRTGYCIAFSAAEQRAALEGIDTVFDRLTAQMDQSLREVDVTRTAS